MPDAQLTLDTNLDTLAAAPLRDALLERRGHDLLLDGSGVERIGGLCLQVLLAARDTWRADGRTLSVLPSEELTRQLGVLGLPGGL